MKEKINEWKKQQMDAKVLYDFSEKMFSRFKM